MTAEVFPTCNHLEPDPTPPFFVQYDPGAFEYHLVRTSDNTRISVASQPAPLDNCAQFFTAYAKRVARLEQQVSQLFDYSQQLTAYIEAGNLAAARRFISQTDDPF